MSIPNSKVSYTVPMEDSDWDSLKDYILSKTDTALFSKFLRIEIRRAFVELKKNGWEVNKELKFTDVRMIGNAIRRSFMIRFSTLPRKINLKDLEGQVAQWRLMVGK